MGVRHILTYARQLDGRGDGGGGVERAQLRLIGGWLAAGRRVTLVVGRLAGPPTAALPTGLEIVALGGRDGLAAGGKWALRGLPAVIGARAPDLVFCAGNTYTSVAAWTRVRLGDATPLTVGKMSNTSDRVDLGAVGRVGNRAWLSLHGRFLDHLVAMTPETAALAGPALGMAGRVSVIPNPPVAPVGLGVQASALPAGRFILGVGRLVAQKRWDRLIAAMPRLSDPAVALVIVGEGERRPALEAQVAALGLERRVFLPGHSADPLPAMARAALVALPSAFEGVPGVLREALSMGTPVVTTASTPAVGEIITSGALGTIVAADDEAALATALVGALEHWLHPAAVRPAPVPQPGHDSATRYLALFDRLAEERAASRRFVDPLAVPLPHPASL